MMLLVACASIILHFVGGQVIFLGTCPDVKAVQNFEASKYLGKWYEVEKYFAIFELGGKCITASYSLNTNGSITVLNTQINYRTASQYTITGQATFVRSPTEAKLSVIFPSLPVQFAAPYWVIATDYENYAVVWSCVQIGIVNSRNLWILTRAQMPTNETLNAAHNVLEKNHISESYIIKTNQKNCSAA